MLTLLDVKHAAQFSVGPSVNLMTVARIFNFPKAGASTEMKPPSAVPVENPRGSLLTVPMYSKYSSTLANSGSVSGVSAEDPIIFVLAAAADDLAANGDEDAVNADVRVATTIAESRSWNVEVHCIIVYTVFTWMT